nr:FMN-binding protein [Cryobacterium roopkundense]
MGSFALDANHRLAVSAPSTAGTVVSGSAPLPTATPTAPPSSSASSASSSAAASAAASASRSGTFTGSVVQTQFGNVQVSVTIADGVITEVTPLQLTTRGGRSVAISNQAAPILRSEVLTAQSDQVQNVSGATYTTYGYLTSLQAALDAAQF